MAKIIQITTDTSGQVNVNPRRVKIISGDALNVVTAAGYLNPTSLQGYVIYNTDIIDMWYGAVGNEFQITTPGTYGEFLPTISNGVITLALNPSNSNVMLTNAVNTMAAGSSIVMAKVNGTEAANAVTANGVAGVITTSSLTTAGGSSYAITWTNSFITSTSVVLLTIAGGTNTTENITLKCASGSSTATLTIYNNTAATALNGTIFISYLVM